LLEGALFRFEVKIMLLQDVKDDVDVFLVALSMFFLGFPRASFCVNGKVIHIH